VFFEICELKKIYTRINLYKNLIYDLDIHNKLKIIKNIIRN